MNAAPLTKFDTIPNPAVIAPNNFKFKSLSDWSYNIAMGCRHGCTFCYVPNTSAIKQETNLEKIPGLVPQQWIDERLSGQHWADYHWGLLPMSKIGTRTLFAPAFGRLRRRRMKGTLLRTGIRQSCSAPLQTPTRLS